MLRYEAHVVPVNAFLQGNLRFKDVIPDVRFAVREERTLMRDIMTDALSRVSLGSLKTREMRSGMFDGADEERAHLIKGTLVRDPAISFWELIQLGDQGSQLASIAAISAMSVMNSTPLACGEKRFTQTQLAACMVRRIGIEFLMNVTADVYCSYPITPLPREWIITDDQPDAVSTPNSGSGSGCMPPSRTRKLPSRAIPVPSLAGETAGRPD